MKPSEINARVAEVDAALKPLQEQVAPLAEQREALLRQKAGLIAANAANQRKIRDSGKLSLKEYSTWHQGIMALPSDDRAAAVSAKATELGL